MVEKQEKKFRERKRKGEKKEKIEKVEQEEHPSWQAKKKAKKEHSGLYFFCFRIRLEISYSNFLCFLKI